MSITLIKVSLAGGTIEWREVKSRIAKTDARLVKVMEQTFDVRPVGNGVRLGPHFGERHGERIAPYHFYAVNKKTQEELILIIEESDDFEYTGRFKFSQEWPEKEQKDEETGHAPKTSGAESKTEGNGRIHREAGKITR